MRMMQKAVFRRMSLRAARGRIEAGARADPAAAAGSGAALPAGQSRLYASCIGIAIKSRTLLQIETGGSRYLLAPHVIYRAPSGETKVLALEISADLAMKVLRSVTLDAAAIRFLRNTPIRFL